MVATPTPWLALCLIGVGMVALAMRSSDADSVITAMKRAESGHSPGRMSNIWQRIVRWRDRRATSQNFDLHLPLAMERVVMAVTSGLDILPALHEAAKGNSDPVSDIFRRIISLCEGGLRMEHALESVAKEVSTPSMKHALIYLNLAYKQGGELVKPLKELSDATQAQYQEVVEEQIAKLPVKAVVPLLLTFTGLIICLITVPVVQISASLERFGDVGK